MAALELAPLGGGEGSDDNRDGGEQQVSLSGGPSVVSQALRDVHPTAPTAVIVHTSPSVVRVPGVASLPGAGAGAGHGAGAGADIDFDEAGERRQALLAADGGMGHNNGGGAGLCSRRCSATFLCAVVGTMLVALFVYEAETGLTFPDVSRADWRTYSQSEHRFDGQTLDHFPVPGASAGLQWSQRYFLVKDFWAAPTGPVIINICGEYTCQGITPTRLFPAQLASEQQALILSVEHRFYGDSVPHNVPLTADNLRLLTARQGLADLSKFILWFQGQIDHNATLVGEDNVLPHGQTRANKWFVLGGSYPGAMAAWFRGLYPNQVVGALASSAVVHAIVDFDRYDGQVATSAGAVCAASLRTVTRESEAQLGAIQARLGTLAPHFTPTDVLYMLADVGAGKVQYGHVADLCAALDPSASAAQLLESYLQIVEAEMASPDFLSDYNRTVLASPIHGGNMRSWWWQTCNEFGWFQIATPGSSASIRSSRVNATYFLDMCSALFDIETPPDAAAVNSFFGYDHVTELGDLPAGHSLPPASKVMYTNGVQDPWQWATVRSTDMHDLKALVINCNGCAHAIDLHTPSADDPQVLVDARLAISKQVDAWMRG